MIYRLAVIWEFFSIMACVYAIYNRKIRLDIKTACFCLITIGLFELTHHFNISNVMTLCVFIFMIFYCMQEFKDSFWGATVSALLTVIVTVMLQFIFLLPFSRLGIEYEEWRMFIINVLVMMFSICILPLVKICKLREILRKCDRFIVFVTITALLVPIIIIIESKFEGGIHIFSYAFIIPALIILFMVILRLGKERDQKESAQNELLATKSFQGKYDDLLTSVRLREHGFKNHLAALLSLKYTSKNYEDLVKNQEKYYGKIREENKFNKLLFLGNGPISGFLYEKFCQAEDEGIYVVYEQKGKFSECMMPSYHIIEILGILIDNAVEAQIGVELANTVRRIEFQFAEQEMTCAFIVKNPHPYVKYKEIEKWFLKNVSNKGENHGLGLYYVNLLCKEYGASILCRNVEYERENWIEMTMEIKKANKSCF